MDLRRLKLSERAIPIAGNLQTNRTSLDPQSKWNALVRGQGARKLVPARNKPARHRLHLYPVRPDGLFDHKS
jgi:hypothetical protein